MTEAILENPAQQKVTIQDRIVHASRLISPVWPLKAAIACNPLLHLEDQNFWTAIELCQEGCDADGDVLRVEFVNRHLIKWLQSYLDEGVAVITLPKKQEGFYATWLELAALDRTFVQSKQERQFLLSLPSSAIEAIELILDHLGVSQESVDPFLLAQMAQLPGWAGYIRWQSEWASSTKVSLTDFLAVRLGIYWIASHKKHLHPTDFYRQRAPKKEFNRQVIEQNEQAFARRFVQKVITGVKQQTQKKTSIAQWVFCIDVRSESFRSELEQIGCYETFGFAGFFGLPVAICEQESERRYASCPVLLRPKWEVDQGKRKGGFFKKILAKVCAIGHQSYVELKYNFGTPFALAESLGGLCAIWMGLKLIAPHWSDQLKGFFFAPALYDSDPMKQIPFKDQVEAAASALSMMNLLEFAPLVVLCGHGSRSQNNPFAATLECGACGGHHGGPNAHLLACILNSASVRQALTTKGIFIPKQTKFIGAEHNTTTDEVTFFDQPHIKEQEILRLKTDAAQAGKANRARRSGTFGHNVGDEQILRRSVDWSETRPEWGLVKNGAFLVGPRALSESLDLEGRAFLHSYDYKSDDQGVYLETILTAPMVVAQWINTQYFFSALDPVLYGSGSKITQNIVGKVGVMQGNGSDLMHGLPVQSLFVSDTQLNHDPLRLLTVVYAPVCVVSEVIERQPTLQKLFYNEWVHLIVIEPANGTAFRLSSQGQWVPWDEGAKQE